MTLSKLGHLFAVNPELLTLNKDRANLWSKSATDLADSLKNLGEFMRELDQQCDKNGNEASVLMISSILSGIAPEIVENVKNLNVCGVAGIFGNLVSPTLNKWSESLTGKRTCIVEDNRIKKYPHYDPNKKEEFQKEFQNDGCIRVMEDFPSLTVIEGLTLPPPFKKFQDLTKDLTKVDIAIVPSEFFKPKSLRSLLPFVAKQGDTFLFVFETESGSEDKEHFSDSEHLFSLTFPGKVSKVSDLYPEGVTIEKDCVAGGPLYIPFADPTFDNSLFISTYELSKNDSCLPKEQSWGIAAPNYLVRPSDIRIGNYALNKIINKVLSSLGKFLRLGG